MPSDWSATTLGDCADFFSGGTPRKSNGAYWEGAIPWFSGKDLKSFYLSDSEDHVTEEGAEAGSRLVPAGTILLLVRGMTLHNNVPIGVLTREATFNQDIKALRARSGVQQSFLVHWLVSQKPRLLSTVHAAGHGTGVLATDRLRALELVLPPPDEQARIAQVFDLIQDKIEQNRRTGGALEGLARATFKAWFVDFEPVQAKAAGQTSFPGMPPAAFAALPDRFVDSEVGLVPEGWEGNVARVDELERKGLLLIGDGYRAKRAELAETGLPFIRAGNVNGTIRTEGAELLGSVAVAKSGVKRSQPWDTVFTSKGTVGRIGLVTPAIGEVVYAPQVCFWRSRKHEELSPVLLHLWMKSPCFTSQWMSVKGQTDMADFVSLSDQRAMKMLVAPHGLQKAADAIVRPLIELQANLADESSKLAALRDYLLPRLLSGRVRVSGCV